MDVQSDLDIKLGIVLLNMGGPKSLDKVRPFLYNLFADPDLIQFPFWLKPFQKIIAWLIAKFRTPSTKKMYQKIGNGSPILEITEEFANKLEKELLQHSISSKVVVAMRYTSPRVTEVITELERCNPDKIVLFSQYPHYANSTSGSSIREFRNVILTSSLKNLDIIEINDWGLEPEYITWWSDQIREKLKELDIPVNNNVHVIFSAHGLPQKYIEQGEKYPERISDAVTKIIQNLKEFDFTYHIAYQSRAGPFPWTQPYTDELLDELAEGNPSAVIMVPLGFVTDHVETLYEIDILYKDQAEALNIPIYERVEVPNANNKYAKDISNLVSRHIRSVS